MSSNMQQALVEVMKAVKLENELKCFEALQHYSEAVDLLKKAIVLNEAETTDILSELVETLEYYSKKIAELQVNFSQKNQNEIVVGCEVLDPKLVQRIEATIVRVKPSENFSSVAGLKDEKEYLEQAVILPIQHPELFQADLKPYRAFLLFGPPGTGKSYLAKAVAGEASSTAFFCLSASDLVSKYQGESEALVRTLFAVAREKKPSIIFIDEIDSLAMSRSDSDGESTRRIKTELLAQMQGVMSDMSGVFTLAATNTPHHLDDAFLRRFDKLLYIPLPCADARREMLEMHFGNIQDVSEKFLNEMVERTDGLSGSDIEILSNKAKMEPVARLKRSGYFIVSQKNGHTSYTPCDPESRNAVQLKLSQIPSYSLNFHPCATTADVRKCVLQARSRIDTSLVSSLEKFAKEKAEIIANPLPRIV